VSRKIARRRNFYLVISGCVMAALLALLANAQSNENGKPACFRVRNPKNIIVLISDGCGYDHVDAASLYQYGKTGTQIYEKFPVRVGMSTYSSGQGYDPKDAWKYWNYVNVQYTDSAAAATAMSTAVKTYGGAVGVDDDLQKLQHAFELAEQKGKSTGVVSSVEWAHATPAAYVAHNVSRNNYEDIGKEMINDSTVDVIMGCGHPLFDRDGNPVATPNTYKYVGGEATWNALVAGTAGGDADGDGVADPWKLVQTRADFQALASGATPKRVCGVPQVYQTLQQGRAGDGHAAPYVVPLIATVPTLEEMTKAALNVLDNNGKGFCLMVEGGAIDWASHANQSGRMIEEEIDFNKTVEAVCAWVKKNGGWKETLVVVTGDHECGYLSGPGSGLVNGKPVWKPLVNNGAGNLPGMQWNSGSHTNALIPFYAKGNGALLLRARARKLDPVRGRYLDNTDLAKVMLSLLK